MLKNPKMLGVGAAALVAIATISIWAFRETPQTVPKAGPESTAPAMIEPEPAVDSPVEAPIGLDESVAGLLNEARLARDAGRIFDPPGTNAIELYASARERAPDNAVVAAELTATLDQALIIAESALLERRSDEAAAVLSRVALADPNHARLPFLNAQLTQISLQDYLEDARAALRESRFEDAATALDGARSLDIADTTAIDAIADDLQNTVTQQRAEELLAQANSRVEDGQLTEPANDNARYYYELVLRNDPENVAARQGLTVVASKLVLQARTEIDKGEFDVAENLLADAGRLDPSSEELAASTAALRAARDREAEARRVAAERRAAAQRAETERLAAEKAAAEKAAAEKAAAEKLAAEQAAAETAAAKRAAAETAAADQAAAETAAAEQAAAERPAADQAAAERTADEAIPEPEVDDTARTVAAAAADSNDRTKPVAAELNATSAPPTPVSLSALKRIKYVAPKFPRAAQRRNISGWVDVVFTVTIDGSVRNIEVRDSDPGDTFVNAAISAIEDWKFEPVIENGIATEKLAAVRLMFAVE